MIKILLFDTADNKEINLDQLTATGLEILYKDTVRLQDNINEKLNEIDEEEKNR